MLASHADSEVAGAWVPWQLGWAWPSPRHASPPTPPVVVVINSTVPTDPDGKFKRPLRTEAGGEAGGDRGHGGLCWRAALLEGSGPGKNAASRCCSASGDQHSRSRGPVRGSCPSPPHRCPRVWDRSISTRTPSKLSLLQIYRWPL